MGQMQQIAACDGFNASALCAAFIDSSHRISESSQSTTGIVRVSPAFADGTFSAQ